MFDTQTVRELVSCFSGLRMVCAHDFAVEMLPYGIISTFHCLSVRTSPLNMALLPCVYMQMDGVTLRHLLRPFAAQEAAAAGRVAAAPEQLFASHSTLQSGPPPRVGPSNELLTQVPGNYCTFDLAPDLTRANASNAAGTIDFTRAGPSSSAATLPKYPRHGLPASSSNEQSSFGALFPNRSANVMGIFTCQSSANEGNVPVNLEAMTTCP